MKMNKKLRRILLTVCSAALLVCVTVGATVAYLTSTTGPVTNTFTVGKVAITLDEADVDVDGVVEKNVDGTDKDRVNANEYKLIPGHTYTKDPTVHVSAGSEDCWLFVKVVNGISGIEADTKIATQMANNGWTLVEEDSNVYAYKTKVPANTDVPVFSSFTIANDADVSSYSNATITITAYAVQADGFASSADAWTNAPKDGWQ